MYYILLQEFDEQHGQKARARSIGRSLFAAGVVSIDLCYYLPCLFQKDQ